MMNPILQIDHVTKQFGGLKALGDVTVWLNSNEVLGLIGPNGAGKSTLFNVITGVYAPEIGSVRFRDSDITGHPAHEITGRGIARTFQNLRLFQNMTALENVMVARHSRSRTRLWDMFLHTPKFIAEEKQIVERAREALDFVGLLRFGNELARNLCYGDQRRLEVARALATEPSVLLLDEPTAGMNPTESTDMVHLFERVRQRNIAIILIEHRMHVVMGLSDRVVVLDYGCPIAEGKPSEVQQNPRVIEAYLGTS